MWNTVIIFSLMFFSDNSNICIILDWFWLIAFSSNHGSYFPAVYGWWSLIRCQILWILSGRVLITFISNNSWVLLWDVVTCKEFDLGILLVWFVRWVRRRDWSKANSPLLRKNLPEYFAQSPWIISFSSLAGKNRLIPRQFPLILLNGSFLGFRTMHMQKALYWVPEGLCISLGLLPVQLFRDFPVLWEL